MLKDSLHIITYSNLILITFSWWISGGVLTAAAANYMAHFTEQSIMELLPHINFFSKIALHHKE